MGEGGQTRVGRAPQNLDGINCHNISMSSGHNLRSIFQMHENDLETQPYDNVCDMTTDTTTQMVLPT